MSTLYVVESLIPGPGSPKGPCHPTDCSRRCQASRRDFLCKMLREEAAEPCSICGKRIGFDTPYIEDSTIEFRTVFTHKTCLGVENVPQLAPAPAVVGGPRAAAGCCS